MKSKDLRRLKEKLPKVPGINGKERYFNSAVLVLLVELEGEYHFLFQKRGGGIRQPGEICFPGGQHDIEDSDCKQTAIRETVEELGICSSKIEVIGKLDTIIVPAGTTIDPFLALADIDSLDELNINQVEVAEVFTIPVDYFEKNEPKEYEAVVKVCPSYINQEGEEVTLFPAEELGVSKMYTEPWGEHKYPLLVYERYKGYLVWGLTARLIQDVVKYLNND